MTLSFASAPGNLFNELGKIGLLAKQLRSYQNAQKTNMIDPVNGVVGQYLAEPDLQAIMGGGYLGILSGSDSGVGSLVQTLAQQSVNRVVFRDNPQPGQTLTNLNVLASLREVIRQMKVQGATVLAMPVTAAPWAIQPPGGHFYGVGNGVVVASVRRPLDGLVLENTFAETLDVFCVADSYTGGATAGNETLGVSGQGNQTDLFAFNWPLGSGLNNVRIQTVNGDASAAQGNLLTNSGFATFLTTANVPDGWLLFAGTPGVNVASNSGVVYSGPNSLQILGDGTTNTQLNQLFASNFWVGSVAGTPLVPLPLTQYSVCLFLRSDGTAPGAGILTVDLTDGYSTPILDPSGASNSFTVDLTQLTTSFTPYTGVFRIPANVPTTQMIRLTLTTPLTNGRSVYLGKMSMGQMTQLYTGGPFLGAHSGSIPLVANDLAEVVAANGRGAGGVLDTFQTLFARLFPQMLANELLLPSSAASPTISDGALIA